MRSLAPCGLLVAAFLLACGGGGGGGAGEGGEDGTGGAGSGEQVAAPVFGVAAGTTPLPFLLTLSTATKYDTTIRYTIDGSTPSADHGLEYSELAEVPVYESMVVKAIAVKAGLRPSEVVSASYTVGKVGPPRFTLGGGTSSAVTDVALSTSTPAATIRYTTDGTLPSETVGTVYTKPIPLSGSMKITAIAYKGATVISDVVSASFQRNGPFPPTIAGAVLTATTFPTDKNFLGGMFVLRNPTDAPLGSHLVLAPFTLSGADELPGNATVIACDHRGSTGILPPGDCPMWSVFFRCDGGCLPGGWGYAFARISADSTTYSTYRVRVLLP